MDKFRCLTADIDKVEIKMITKKFYEEAIGNITPVLPDASKISPEELVLKYTYLLKYMGANRISEMLILTDVVEDRMKLNSEKYMEEKKRIMNSLTDPNSRNIYDDFKKNEEKEIQTQNTLLPFAYYLRRMSDQMIKDEKNYKSLTVKECLQICERILGKYQIYGFCSSFMVVDTENDRHTFINGDMDSLIAMLSAAIHGYIEDASERSGITIDEFFINLAKKQQSEECRKGSISANISFVTPSINKKRQNVMEQLRDVMEDDIQTIDMILKCIAKKNGTYLVCVRLIEDIRFVAGGTEKDMESMVGQIISIMLEKSKKNEALSFNNIARSILNNPGLREKSAKNAYEEAFM